MTIRFEGRVAVITGAGNGLGRAHAVMLAERGAAVVINDVGGAVDGSGTSTSAADRAVADIVSAGGTAIANYDSVADPAGAERMIAAAVERFGKVDILVNNAGILRDKTFAKMPLEDFRQVMEIHLMGSVHCTRAAWPHMKEQKYGRVVMTSSGAGLYGNFGQSNYGTAKMALVGLMNVLKLEGARDGILVNTVAPIAATRMTAALMPPHALPHLKSEFVSAMVAYFCSDDCQVSGEIVSAGAGYFAKAQMVEAAGVFLDTDEPADPDRVAALFGQISDMSRAAGFHSAEEYTAKAFVRFLGEAEEAAS
jgi:NAD(P)-dependent dehydrogenase (short-subunit alcohol dehydrogenase family)